MGKLLWRDIRASLGRFIAIALIILLGVLIFVGVKATGPGLTDSATAMLNQHHLADVQLVSDKGITSQDIRAAEKVSGVTAQKVKFKYALGGQNKDAVALYGYTNNRGLNRLKVTAGHLPHANNEIVLDQRAQTQEHYKIGDSYTFRNQANLKRRTYKIVGFVQSPLYIDNTTRGSTNIGTGQVAYFAYINNSQMNLPTATLLNIRFASLAAKDPFSHAYRHAVNQKLAQLKDAFKDRAKERQAEIVATGNRKLKSETQRINAAQEKVKRAQQRLISASNGHIKTTTQLSAATKKLNQQKAKMTAAKIKLAKAATPTYTWSTREDLAGFSAYGDSADRIAAIANVFPVFFFLLAALITFTTVTRMVEEARMQIGTFKALGFSNFAIAKNYVSYAFLAGLLGVILGSFIGNQYLPRFVISLYKGYIFNIPVIHYQWDQIAIAALLSFVATVGAALYVILKQVNEVPSALMRPKAPKSAKKIWLEHFTWLWSKLQFYQKVSYRNLFRFKSRAFMTILGIAGGTALILTGFGISDSIGASGHRQFSQVINYQAVVQANNSNHLKDVRSTISKSAHYRASTAVGTSVVKAKAGSSQLNDVTMYVPQDPQRFAHYVHLHSVKTNATVPLSDSGIVISEKIATTLNLKRGSQLHLTTANGHRATIRVTSIVKNYIGHFMYLSPRAYQKAFHHSPKIETLMVRLKNISGKSQSNLSQKWLNNNPHILGVNFTSDQRKTVSNMSSQMTPVVLIFILLSGILSFVVLYNLTNINISERIRELSTIKVLGFFNREVTMYIARENIVLAIVGILVGFGFGNLLTLYVLHQAETPTVVFPLTIHFQWYVVATLLMILFNVIVILVAHRHLKRVDMVAALKSSE